MKLKDPSDKAYFLVDINRLDLLETLRDDEDIPKELFETFIKRRKSLVSGLADFRKSQISKQGWRSSRWKHLRGIHKFHRSLAGKRMHRSIGRFLSTKIMRSSQKNHDESLDVLQMDALKALSSYKTHAYIENDYYSPLSESEEYFSFLEYMIPLLNNIEWKIYQDAETELNEDEYELLLRLIDEKEFCKSFSETLDNSISPEKVYELYRGVQQRMITDGSSKEETYFLTRHMENLLPCLISEREKISKQTMQ